MKKFLLYIHQLPQNLLGLLVIFFSYAVYHEHFKVWFTECKFGVSLGKYIIISDQSTMNSLKHERGHQEQSRRLGWLYLIIIGLPSFFGNIYDRIFHKKWDSERRERWYFSQPWEAQADRFGGVERW